jgi:hypothetical protein
VILWVAILAFGFSLPLPGDYKDRYYPEPDFITVEKEGRIIDYLHCERIAMDYPELTGRGDVNISLDADGDIWAAVAGAPLDKVKRLFRSRDRGLTWTSVPLPPTRDRYLAAFTTLSNNNLLLVTSLKPTSPRIYLSDDMGGSWELTDTVPPDPFQYAGEGFLSLTQLRGGRILLPIARYNDDPYHTCIQGGIFVSADNGCTFPTVHSTFEFCMEAHIVELQSGDLLGAFRYQRHRNPGETDEDILALGGNIDPDHTFTFKHVFLGDSFDGGVTWSNLRPLRDASGRALLQYGQCHGQLIQVPDDRVALVYDNRYPAEERDVRARVSSDNGQTWDPTIYYISFGRGNPASVVLDDGTIVTVTGNWPYGPRGPVGPPSVQAVRWRLSADKTIKKNTIRRNGSGN